MKLSAAYVGSIRVYLQRRSDPVPIEIARDEPWTLEAFDEYVSRFSSAPAWPTGTRVWFEVTTDNS